MSAAARSRPAATNTAPRDERGQGRELALLALCHLESYPSGEHREALELLWRNPPRDEGDRGSAFADLVAREGARRRGHALVCGVLDHWDRVNDAIAQTSVRWRMDRMAQVDRNVLRLAAYELDQAASTPRPVVLAEAVRLARRYGSERSAGFVNGVADALARRLRPEGDG